MRVAIDLLVLTWYERLVLPGSEPLVYRPTTVTRWNLHRFATKGCLRCWKAWPQACSSPRPDAILLMQGSKGHLPRRSITGNHKEARPHTQRLQRCPGGEHTLQSEGCDQHTDGFSWQRPLSKRCAKDPRRPPLWEAPSNKTAQKGCGSAWRSGRGGLFAEPFEEPKNRRCCSG